MQYLKPPLSFEQQADLLIGRGMTGPRSLMIDRLQVVNYYRLSAYWHSFRNPDDSFQAGTNFETVWKRYVFDRRLRIVIMDAIERIEVAVRTQLSYHHSHLHTSPFAYVDDPMALPGLTLDERTKFIEQIAYETRHSRETFVRHFREKYGDTHPLMPVWMATEIMTFGCVLTFYRGVLPDIRKAIAALFGVQDTVLDSWLLSLNTIRNICAHHGRLWNREMGLKPKIPNKDPRWHTPVAVTNERVFGVLSVLKYCLDRIAPQSHWPERVQSLISGYPEIPLRSMGFPDNWKDCPIWNRNQQ